jgi:hypothetical protein
MADPSVGVLDPRDPDAVHVAFDADGAQVANAHATRRVKVADWFACACQCIRTEDESDAVTQRPWRTENTLAWYSNNLTRALLLDGLSPPVGPCGVTGEIVLTFEVESMLRRGEFDPARYVIAHEIAHVLDALSWVVPAAQYWDAFCENVNPLGLDAEDLIQDHWMLCATLDDYGAAGELAAIERYWPGHARAWFDAFNTRYREP